MTPEELETVRLVVTQAVAEALAAKPPKSRAGGLLTFEQASELLGGTPVGTIRNWVWEGRLKAYKPGKHPLVKESELLALVESNETTRKRAARRKAARAAAAMDDPSSAR